jgi:hypothetical protein
MVRALRLCFESCIKNRRHVHMLTRARAHTHTHMHTHIHTHAHARARNVGSTLGLEGASSPVFSPRDSKHQTSSLLLPPIDLAQLFVDMGLGDYVERFQLEAVHLDMLLTMDFKQLDALGVCVRVCVCMCVYGCGCVCV